MILPIQKIKEMNLVQNMLSEELQLQPAGVDFTVKSINKWTDGGIIDFDNEKRKISDLEELKFEKSLKLEKGAYLVCFNETVSLPNNVMAFVQTRSSLLRMGATVTAGYIDPGYSGPILAVLNVFNENGIEVIKNARVCQWRFDLLSEKAETLYDGQYQNQENL